MKIKLSNTKPRNPFVAASMRRKAGAHGGGNARQLSRVALRREWQREAERHGLSP